MAQTLTGIEIGAYRLKIALAKNSQIKLFNSLEIPEGMTQGGNLVAFDGMASFLQKKAKGSIKTGNVAIALPDSLSYLRRLHLPAMTHAQLAVNLPYEFSDVIKGQEDAYIFDYALIKMDEEAKEMDIFGAAIRRDIMESYMNMFSKVGYKLIKATPRVLALGALLPELDCDHEKDFAFLDIGFIDTKVDIYSSGVYEVTRTIDLGIKDVIAQVAEVLECDEHVADEYLRNNSKDVQNSQQCMNVYASIATEVMRAINYYTYENRDNTLERLYYCGGGSRIEPLIHALKETVPLPIEPLSSLSEKLNLNDALIDGPAAVGIALQAVENE